MTINFELMQGSRDDVYVVVRNVGKFNAVCVCIVIRRILVLETFV